jgi:hypothetical protein
MAVGESRHLKLKWRIAAEDSWVYLTCHLGDQKGDLDQDHVEVIAKRR